MANPQLVEVPESVLKSLECVNCSLHASIAPVTYDEDNNILCGRCYDEKLNFQRAIAFEVVQAILLFPCRYNKYGCVSKIKANNMASHEAKCEFRNIINCPLLESQLKCAWRGRLTVLRKHCIKDHYSLVRSNRTFVLFLKKQAFPDIYIVTKSNYFFVLRSTVMNLESDFLIQISVQNCTTENESKLGSYEIKFMNENATIKFSNLIFSYTNSYSEALQNDHVQVNTKLLKDILKVTDDMITFKLKLVDLDNPENIKKSPSTVKKTKKIQEEKNLEDLEKSPLVVQQTNEKNEERQNIGSLAILKELNCHKCLKFLRPPVKVCKNRHSFCSSCTDEDNICQICEVPYEGTLNTFLENLVQNIQLPCDNKLLGCCYKGNGESFYNHTIDCSFKLTECPLKLSTNCEWQGVYKNHISHLQSDHSSRIHSVSNKEIIIIHNLQCSIPVGFEIFYFKNVNVYIRLCFKRDLPQSYSWSFDHIGLKEGNPSPHKIKIEFIDQTQSGKILIAGFPCFGCQNQDMVEDFIGNINLLKPFISKNQLLAVKYQLTN